MRLAPYSRRDEERRGAGLAARPLERRPDDEASAGLLLDDSLAGAALPLDALSAEPKRCQTPGAGCG